MIFVGAVHVEELEIDHLAEKLVLHAPHVEKFFRIAVHVERTKLRHELESIGKTEFAVAVGGGAACGDEAGSGLKSGKADFHRVVEVVLHEKIGVALGGGGTRSHVDHALHALQLLAGAELSKELVAVHVVAVAQVGKILPLFRGRKIVHHKDVVHALTVQFPYHVCADKAGAACDYDHSCPFRVAFVVCTRVMLPSALCLASMPNMMTVCRSGRPNRKSSISF